MSDGRRQAELELHAYRDGELPFWKRWRVARRLAREPRARRELAALEGMGALLRDHAASAPAPDLWDAIRAQLATAPRPAPVDADAAADPEGSSWLSGWLGAALAAASVALVMATGLRTGDAAPVNSLRWLDAKGKPVMVLQDDREATIIWVLSKPEQTTRRAGGRDAMA